MQKRTAAILIGFVILLLLGLLGWIVWPLLSNLKKPAQQPTPLPGQITVSSTVPTPGQTGPTFLTAPKPAATNSALTPEEQERQAQEALLRQATIFVEREGSYSNADSFVTIKEVYASVTSDVMSYLESVRTDLLRQHPATGSSWGQTTVSVSPRIDSGTPLLSSNVAEVSVQVQLTVNDAGKDKVSYGETNLSLTKVNGNWLVSHITWKAL